MESKRRRRPQAVEEVEADAISNVAPTYRDVNAAAKASPVAQGGVSWPRARMQVG